MRTYDLVMTHKLDADDFFIQRIQQHCAERGLNFFLIEPLWVEEFLEKFRQEKIWARVLLNLHSEHHQPEDPYHRLVKLAAERKTAVIDPPAISQPSFDKARLHARLHAAGLNIPFTLIVAHERITDFQLSPLDLANLGSPFVVKPAMGYGKRGVNLGATGKADLERCVTEWPDAHYLLQRLVVPRKLEQGPAYFRIFHAFGGVWCCWWNCYTDQYRNVTEAEIEQFKLSPLREISTRLARLTEMRFFSTEVAVVESGEYVLIDYVNDQCHMLAQSASPQLGVPNEVVAGIAFRLVEGAQQLIQNAR
jgi:glutathione synthase/RimK-type ligase-like ATP-grasp enzyme